MEILFLQSLQLVKTFKIAFGLPPEENYSLSKTADFHQLPVGQTYLISKSSPATTMATCGLGLTAKVCSNFQIINSNLSKRAMGLPTVRFAQFCATMKA